MPSAATSVNVRRVSSMLAGLFALLAALLVGAGPAAAVAPLDHLDGQITDQVGALTPEGRVELEEAIATLPEGESLYVVYVDSFDGLSGAQWAADTHDRAQLGSAWLLAIATGDRLWGTGYLTGTDYNRISAVNTATQNSLYGFAADPDNFNWAEPGIAVTHAIIDPGSVGHGLSETAAVLITIGSIVGVAAIITPLIIRAHRKAKERAQADFAALWSLHQLPTDQQQSLDDARRQISVAVDFLTAHDAQVSQLSREYVQLAMDLYEGAKAAVAAGAAAVYDRPVMDVLDDARAYARAGLGTAANDVGDAIGEKQLSRQFGFDLNMQTWAAMRLATDYPRLGDGWSGQVTRSARLGGSFAGVGGSYGMTRSGISGSFGDARVGVGGSFGQTGVGGSFGNGVGGSFDSGGRGGSFAPTKSFDRGPGGDLYVPPSSSSGASSGGSSGSGGSF